LFPELLHKAKIPDRLSRKAEGYGPLKP